MISSVTSSRNLVELLAEWRSAAPAYEALADRIRLLVIDGRLPAGTRLPAERDLAARLGVSRTTVTAAYQRVREAGYGVSRQGSGTQVVHPVTTIVPADAPSQLLDFTQAALTAPEATMDAVRRATEQLPAFLTTTGYDTMGIPITREAIARRYTERGLPTDADQVLVTVGALQAISLVARTFVSRGERALVEAPTYPHACEAFAQAGARLVTAPVSNETPNGWDVETFESVLRRTSPTLAYLMPDFQNPTGCTMSLAVRHRILEAATAQSTIVVVDETSAELNIDRPGTFAPFATLANGAKVITIGSASKSMWGGLRVGWIRAERSIIRRLHAVRASFDLGAPVLDQLVTAELFDRYDEVLGDRRAILREGRDAVEHMIGEAFPDWQVPHVHGGLAAWIGLGTPVSSQLALAARTEGLLISAGPRFGIDGSFERYLRVPITYPADQVQRAVAALRRAWPIASRMPYTDPHGLAAVV